MFEDDEDEDGNDKSSAASGDIPLGCLQPIAYLWTRTVRCKNPSCGAAVPLLKQTWVCKKAERYVALKVVAPRGEKQVKFDVVECSRESEFDFDPSGFSRGGNATCPFCGTVADVDHVKAEGWQGRMASQPMAVVGIRPGLDGKVYLSPDDDLPDQVNLKQRVAALCKRSGLTVPAEPIANLSADCADNSLGITVRPYGIRTFGDLFSRRQLLCLLAFADAVATISPPKSGDASEQERDIALRTCLSIIVTVHAP